MHDEEIRAVEDVENALQSATTDEQRLGLLEQDIKLQEGIVFNLRYGLAKAEGVLEGLYRLRETLGAPELSHKHTLRGRVIKYLSLHEPQNCTDLAKSLSTPVTTMNMCLNRNKKIFEKDANNAWRLTQEAARKVQSADTRAPDQD